MCGLKPCKSPNCTWSESHRLAMEIKFIQKQFPEKHDRAEFYRGVKQKRGEAAAIKLIDQVNQARRAGK